MRISRLICVVVVVLLAVSAPAHAADDALLMQAQDALRRGDPATAYRLLAPLQSERAGDPNYDYLLGMAALDTGRATEAVFALERVLEVNPKHPQARAEIARAYFQLGEIEAARGEFLQVKETGIDPRVGATIDRFLSLIDQRMAAKRTQLRAYVETTFGYDTNVNSGTADSQLALPILPTPVVLDSSSVEAEDFFLAFGGGLNYRHQLRDTVAVLASFNANKRINKNEDQFDTGLIDGSVGVAWTTGKSVWTVLLQASSFYKDNLRDNGGRDAHGGSLQWQYNLDDRRQISAFGQFSNLHYPAVDIRDADRSVLGLGYAQAQAGGTVWFTGAYVGEEREKAADVPYFGHDLFGVRLGGQMDWRDNLNLFGSVSYEFRRYGGTDPLFLNIRHDNQYIATLGLNWVPGKDWRMTPSYSYTRQDANQAVYDFHRHLISLTLRRDF